MNDLVIYIHGKGGSASECEHYKPLFPGREVEGIVYAADTPWDAGGELRCRIARLREKHDSIILIANSIGAFFSMYADVDKLIKRAFFISPIVNMEKLICGMMSQAGLTENELRSKGTVKTADGNILSWKYLSYVRENPVLWRAQTEILYGSRDALTSYNDITAFAAEHNAGLTVMENGEHWFHTDEQMDFLDRWIIAKCKEEL